jgi:thiol-disulfide isomerase/thioredoxin
VTGLYVLVGVVVVVAIVAVVRRLRDGRLREVAPAAAAPVPPDLAVLSAVGFVPGEAAVTFVQFSSAFCAPCRATRAILSDIAASVDDVRHVEVDAESQLEAVRALGILRTPTTLVVDRTGVVVQRASGQPRKADVVAAVGRILLSPSALTSHVSEGETR